MAINKRVKSFSPYSYGAQYRKAGSNPFNKTAAYINAATLQEEQNVISKRAPIYNTFATNLFIYTFDDNCNYKFVKAESIFQIDLIANKTKERFDYVDYVFPHEHSEIVLEKGLGFSWINETTIKTYEEFDYYFDYILLNGNEYVRETEFSLTSDRKIKIKFNRHYDSLKIVLFNIDEAFNVFEENVEMNEIDNSPYIQNRMGSLDVIPVIYDMNNVRYDLKYDISPNYISFMSGSIETVNDIETQKEAAKEEIIRMMNENENVPSSVLYVENENFRFNTDVLELIEKKERMIDESPCNKSANVIKSFLYNCNDMKQYYAKYGQNTNEMKWNGNVLKIAHGFNRYVKVTVDYVLQDGVNETVNRMNYSLKMNSMNEIEINFNTTEMSEYCITIFGV